MSEGQLKQYRVRKSGGGLPAPSNIITCRTRRTAISRMTAEADRDIRDGVRKVTYWVTDPDGGPRLARISVDQYGRVDREVRK